MNDLLELFTYIILVALMMGGWRTLRHGTKTHDRKAILLGILLYVMVVVLYLLSANLLGKV